VSWIQSSRGTILPPRLEEEPIAEKPVVVVTRKLPPAVEARLEKDYTPKLNPKDHLYSADELIDLCADAAAILPCHTEQINEALIGRLPDNVRIIANFSVGVDHCELATAKARGIKVTNTPDVLSEATA
jgi:lactate dehydrogenase-like 2-hydroxyacid dehydrogenase